MHQHDDYSCGRVCVYMVTANLGGKVSRKWLKYLLQTNEASGTPQQNIINALRDFGYACNVTTDVGIRSIKRRLGKGLAIACVDDNQHWIVVRGLGKNRVYVADPLPLNPQYHSLTKFAQRVKNGSIIFVKRKGR